MKKHSPNTARKNNHDGYFCKNTVQIETAMGTFIKTLSKWTNTGEFPLMCLLVAARLQISSEEYLANPLQNFVRTNHPSHAIFSSVFHMIKAMESILGNLFGKDFKYVGILESVIIIDILLLSPHDLFS